MLLSPLFFVLVLFGIAGNEVAGYRGQQSNKPVLNPEFHQWLNNFYNQLIPDHLANLQATVTSNVSQTPKVGPTLPSIWNGTGDSIQQMGNASNQQVVAFGVNVTMMSDATKKQSASIGQEPFQWGPEAFHQAGNSTITQITLTSNMTFLILNGAKYIASPGTFNNLFGWTLGATNAGIVTWNGMKLTRWILQIPTGNTSYELLVTSDNTPVRQELNTTVPESVPVYGGKRYSQKHVFNTFHANSALVPDPFENFDINDYLEPMRCEPEVEPIKNVTMFIFHPTNNFEIAGQDLGDAQGDVFFTCVDVMLKQPGQIDHDYQWITQWSIELNPTFGQYQNCNGYPSNCLGDEHFAVGHAAAQNLGRPVLGQCQLNPETGEWFSLPVGGECPASVTPDFKQCSWRKTRVKTIDSKCLFDTHNFRSMCEVDGQAPFKAATDIFSQAFSSDNVSDGGCPPINPSQN